MEIFISLGKWLHGGEKVPQMWACWVPYPEGREAPKSASTLEEGPNWSGQSHLVLSRHCLPKQAQGQDWIQKSSQFKQNLFDQLLSSSGNHQLWERSLKDLVQSSFFSFILDFPLLNTHILHSRFWWTRTFVPRLQEPWSDAPLSLPCLFWACHIHFPPWVSANASLLPASVLSLMEHWPRAPDDSWNCIPSVG